MPNYIAIQSDNTNELRLNWNTFIYICKHVLLKYYENIVGISSLLLMLFKDIYVLSENYVMDSSNDIIDMCLRIVEESITADKLSSYLSR